jgi:hypothetical protein
VDCSGSISIFAHLLALCGREAVHQSSTCITNSDTSSCSIRRCGGTDICAWLRKRWKEELTYMFSIVMVLLMFVVIVAWDVEAAGKDDR